jgi:hypothetical protein
MTCRSLLPDPLPGYDSLQQQLLIEVLAEMVRRSLLKLAQAKTTAQQRQEPQIASQPTVS